MIDSQVVELYPIYEQQTTGRRANICLVQADALEAISHFVRPNSVDVVITSPPYNLGIQYSQYQDDLPRANYLEWLDRWAMIVKEVLSDQGSLFLNIGSKPTDPWVPFDVLGVMRRHFELQNVIHWIKSIAIQRSEVGNYPMIQGNIVVGHYKPINSGRFLNDCHEYIFHLTKSGKTPLDREAIGVPYQDQNNIERWKKGSSGRHCRGNTWFIPYDTIHARKEQRPHPASYPIELPARCIRLHGVERTGLVMDPFLGIGSTAIACRELEKNFIGFEIARDYFEIACSRLSE